MDQRPSAIRRVLIPSLSGPGGAAALARLRALFPGAVLAARGDGGLPAVGIDAGRWLEPEADLLGFDRRVHAAEERGDFCLVVEGGARASARVAAQALLRWQRLIPVRNRASRSRAFDALLARHRAWHDLSKPLVRADHDHALDAWQWVLRLDPGAGAAVQIAALLHDLERLEGEADFRIEHRARDYGAFKRAHARWGARRARALLAEVGAEPRLARRVAALVAVHEGRGAGPSADLLNDADGLSFFSLNSAGFLAYYGAAHTRLKVDYTLARLGPGARAWLGALRLPSEVGEMLRGALGGRGGGASVPSRSSQGS